MRRRLLLTACLSLLTFSSVQAEGIQGNARFSPPPKAARIPIVQTTLAPFAYIRFCVQNVGDCRQSNGPQTVDWDAATKTEVTRINLRVNRSITPKADAVESWDADVTSGDCEDYALTKRRALLARGLPSGALRIATAMTPEGEWHTVLVIATTSGDMVLDNRVGEIRLWSKTGLRWSKIASAEDPSVWMSVRGGPKMQGALATAAAN